MGAVTFSAMQASASLPNGAKPGQTPTPPLPLQRRAPQTRMRLSVCASGVRVVFGCGCLGEGL